MTRGDGVVDRVLHHYPRCFGCGSANNSGLRLTPRWDGQRAVLEYRPQPETEGGPGVVHGGFIGALVDEVAALVSAEHADGPTVTKRAEIHYRSPMPVGAAVKIVSAVSDESGRNLTVKTTLSNVDSGKVFAQANSVFVKLPPAVWIRAAAAARRGGGDVNWHGVNPSHFLRWQMKGGLGHVLRRALLSADLKIRVEITDAGPALWSVVAGPNGFAAHENADTEWDVRFRGPFRHWLRLIRSESSVTDLDTHDNVDIHGDRSALAALAAALDFGRFS